MKRKSYKRPLPEWAYPVDVDADVAGMGEISVADPVALYKFPQDDRHLKGGVVMVWSQVLDVQRGVPATVCPLVKKTIIFDHLCVTLKI